MAQIYCPLTVSCVASLGIIFLSMGKFVPISPIHNISLLAEVKAAWYHQAPNCNLNKYWPSSMMACGITRPQCVYTLRPEQNDIIRFADDILKFIFLKGDLYVLIQSSYKFIWQHWLLIKNTPVELDQCSCCWCSSSFSHQPISSHGIDYV